MTFEIFVSSAVVSTVFGFIGNIVAAKIAQRTAIKTAQETAAQEIKKMERTWEREDVVSSEEEFAAMADAVARYIHRDTIPHANEAIGLVAAVRSKEYGELGRILDGLYESLNDRDTVRSDVELTKAINKKREIREHLAGRVSE